MIGLALLGALAGALAPRTSRILLSAALGSVFLLVTLPLEAGFASLVALLGAGLVWQIVARSRQRAREKREWPRPLRPERSRTLRWAGSLGWCVTFLVLLAVWVTVTVPGYDAASVSDPSRLLVLAGRGHLGRPGLVLLPHNNFYLSGRPLPVALVGGERGSWVRLAFPFTGRSLTRTVHRMRAVKEPRELEAMRRAAAITSRTFAEIEPLIRPGVNESEIEERILRSFFEQGATGVAFESIVGSGSNAVLPHSEANDSVMTEGLVVIDIGCSVDSYASDMTRTFPVTGRLTDAQARLIEVVIAAGDAAREVLKAGVSRRDVHRAAKEVIEEAGFGPFFTHFVGHGVGLSVHDPSADPLEAGMVLTIEPGIYVPAGADTDPVYWNLGARIEDTYVVTEDGWEEITGYPRYPGSARSEPPEADSGSETEEPPAADP